MFRKRCQCRALAHPWTLIKPQTLFQGRVAGGVYFSTDSHRRPGGAEESGPGEKEDKHCHLSTLILGVSRESLSFWMHSWHHEEPTHGEGRWRDRVVGNYLLLGVGLPPRMTTSSKGSTTQKLPEMVLLILIIFLQVGQPGSPSLSGQGRLSQTLDFRTQWKA